MCSNNTQAHPPIDAKNPKETSSNATSTNITHCGRGARGRSSNPFIISEAEESGEDDTHSKLSTLSKNNLSSESDSDSDSDSDDGFIVDNTCFD